MREDLAKLLEASRGNADDDEPVTRSIPSMDTHRRYLEKAKIPYVDDRGRRADFHALRHSYGTLLAKSGVAPRVAMSLIRHTNMRLTMNVYTGPGIFDLAGAVESDQKSSNSAEVETSSSFGAVKASVAVSTPMTADMELEFVIGEWWNLHPAVRSALDRNSARGSSFLIRDRTGARAYKFPKCSGHREGAGSQPPSSANQIDV